MRFFRVVGSGLFAILVGETSLAFASIEHGALPVVTAAGVWVGCSLLGFTAGLVTGALKYGFLVPEKVVVINSHHLQDRHQLLGTATGFVSGMFFAGSYLFG